MSANPEVRASDADRDHIAALLTAHAAEGRLTIEEMQQRTDGVYGARTLGELQHLVADLPLPGGPGLPVSPDADQAVRPCAYGRARSAEVAGGLRARWVTYSSVALLCIAVWLGTSLASAALLYFWPVWVIGPWGVALLAKTLRARHADRPGAPARTGSRHGGPPRMTAGGGVR